MAILKFRIYFEEDESVYRDVVIRHTQSFIELHETILKGYEFDNKHKATFYRSNDHWLRGREISLEQYEKEYKAPPLLMAETTIGSEIRDPTSVLSIHTISIRTGPSCGTHQCIQRRKPKDHLPCPCTAQKVLHRASMAPKDCWVKNLPMLKRNMI